MNTPVFANGQMVMNPGDELTALRARVAELERKSADLTWTNEAVNALASCAESARGQEFLRALVRQLSDTLKVGHVFLSEWVPGRTDRLRTVAGWRRDRVAETRKYDLVGTPCKIVLEKGEAFFPCGTRQLFPDDEYVVLHNIESYMGTSLLNRAGRPAGHLCIMDDRPFLFDHAQGRAIVKVFAERAGAELERLQAEEILRQREERFRTLYDDNPSMYFTLSPDGTIISVNRYGAGQLGYTADELIGRSVLMVFDAADRQTVLSQLKECMDNSFQSFTWEIQKIRKDGTRLWVQERARAITDSNGAFTILVICEDVTARKRSEALLAAEMRCLELIAQDTPLSGVLETLCTMIEHQNQELLCSILLLDPHTRRLHPSAAPSLPRSYLRAIDGVTIGPAVGSCGTAAFRGKTVIVSDIAQDPLWADCRSLALGHGLRACWSMPILSPSKQVLGTFAIYSHRAHQPTPADLSLMERVTHLAGIALAKAQAEGEREQLSRDLHDNILQSLYAVGMQLEAAKLAREGAPRTCETHITRAIGQLNCLMRDVREFITLLTRRSAVKSDFGEALRQLAASMGAAEQAPPEIEMEEAVRSKLTPFQEQQLLNIAREALSNSLRHAQAARRWVRLSHTTDTIRLEIADDGIGFPARRPPRRGHGLANMAARAKKLRARFSLESEPGRGTCIIIDVPIEKGSIQNEIPHDSAGDRRRPRGRAYRAQRGA